jgi:hypothetical protein
MVEIFKKDKMGLYQNLASFQEVLLARRQRSVAGAGIIVGAP